MTNQLDLNSNKKLYGLDHLRALAIIVVFFYHYYIVSDGLPEWLPNVASFGWVGVDLFFVLSGFLIASQLFAQIKSGQPISISDFYIKRFFRIVPAFLVTVGLYFCFPIFREKEALPPIWKFLTFTQNIGLRLNGYGTFSHAWSLCVEEHFYLLLPIVLMFLLKFKRFAKSYWLLVFLFLFGLFIRFYCYHYVYLPKIENGNGWVYWYQYIYYPTYSRLDGLLVGVSIAALYQFLPNYWRKMAQYANRLILLGLCVLVGAYFLCIHQQTFTASVFGFPMIAIGFGCVVLGAISPASFLYQRQSTITTFIATLSYAIYLTHKGVIHLTHVLLARFDINDNVMLLICMVTCVLCAYGMNKVIEKPFMKLRTRILAK